MSSDALTPHASALPTRRSRLVRSAARLILRVLGWRVHGEMPLQHKFVVVCAPHTSRWDLSLTVLTGVATGIQVRWVGKHTLFWWPNRLLLRAIGGVPVDRSGGKDAVKAIAQVFGEHQDLALAISPEGAKRWRPWWRSGFWYVAQAAEVPIVVAALDWGQKVARIGPTFVPTTIEADMDRIRAALREVVPRHPDRFGPVRLEREVPEEERAQLADDPHPEAKR
jgi:1-acyl-sn-glycerol-3-phosphate acyltransferase